ncbi:MAG: hypothetical protein ACXADY_02575 [Candidatus Hodarchaeales archaeon]|jgi:hypothetical protein
MTSQERTDLDMKLPGRMPILWKRKVRNFIKKDRQHALMAFFENFKLGKDTSKMKYGLEQLLPASLTFILSSFKEFNREETSSFLELISSPEFLTYISDLDREKQEVILFQIYNNWNYDLNQDSIRSILNQLDPNLSELLYDKISKQRTKSDISGSIEIMQLWGTEILPIVLLSYLKNPFQSVEPLFKELDPEQRVQVFQKTTSLSKTQLQNLLQLISPTEDEISYLFAIQHFLKKESLNLLIKWLVNKNLDHELVLKGFQKNKTVDNLSFVVNYFIACIKQKTYPATDIIVLILSFEEFPIAHEILIKLNSSKEEKPLKILVSSLNRLKEQVPRYSKFFNSEFKTYASHNVELILKAYLESKHESHRQLLLPFLQDAAGKNWKMIIKTTVETRVSIPPNLIFDIFSTCSNRIKQNIGKYIIVQSWVTQLTFLYSEFEIFRSALTSTEELSVTIQALLDPFLQQHVSERFEQIIRLGKKITFPQLAFASMMNLTHIEKLLDTIGSSKELLEFWEETFLMCSKDALPVLLKEFLTKDRKKKNYLIPLLNKLVSLELSQFWTYSRTISSQDVSRLKPILTHAFKASIPTIGEDLSQLPEFHLTFIFEHILPQFTSSAHRILYSLLSLRETSNIQESVIQRTILETIRLDPEELLIIVIIRCSKIITNPRFSNLVPGLVNNLFSFYPVPSLAIVDSHKLTMLLASIKSFLSSLSLTETENVILTVIITLKSSILNSIIIDYLLQWSRKRKEDYSLLNQLLTKFEDTDFSIEGKNILSDFIQNLVGESPNNDLLILKTFKRKPRSQSLLLPMFFTHTSQYTIEKILLDSPIDPLEENILKAIINYFESQPPERPEEYFFTLYKKVRGKEGVQRAILPLLGEYCSWNNLSMLMELVEKEKYQKEYEKALIKFSSRFDIHSPKALRQIWISGLKDVYNGLKEPRTLLQSHCPQCNNPILEKQKNCGFCSQRLTCIICRKSVAQLQIEEEVVQCPQCSGFFHRRHLLESIKSKNKCPVCNVSFQEAEVDSLPAFRFFFQ